MSRIKGKDTTPELIVRSLVFGMGYRYRLHDNRLPGKPDLVFRGKRKVIFVHGCFWHMHDCRFGQVKPRTNAKFWAEKRARNVKRDHDTSAKLSADGWAQLIIWECETKNLDLIRGKIKKFLSR